MRKQFLECGKIVSVQGLDGEVRVYPWSDSAESLIEFEVFYFDEGKTPVRVERARAQKGMLILKLEGTDTREQALALRGRILYLDRDEDLLEEGEYYVQDLLGMEVYDADTGELYGTLCDVSSTGANDVYHVRFADGAVKLVPAIKQVVLSTDLERNRMEIRPLRGLFD